MYLIQGASKNVLIDPGVVTNSRILRERLNQVGMNPTDIDLVVLTHEHMDHGGAAIFFSENATVAAHRSAADPSSRSEPRVCGQN